MVVTLVAVSWFLRPGATDDVPDMPVLILEPVGIGLGAVTGWLDGEPVERLGVGVDEGAHLNAPSSLAGRPAAEIGASANPSQAELLVRRTLVLEFLSERLCRRPAAPERQGVQVADLHSLLVWR